MTRGNVGCLFAAVVAAAGLTLLVQQLPQHATVWHLLLLSLLLFVVGVCAPLSAAGALAYVCGRCWFAAEDHHIAARKPKPRPVPHRAGSVQRRTPPPVREDIPVVDGALPGPEQRPAHVPAPARTLVMPTVPDGALDAWHEAVASQAAPSPFEPPPSETARVRTSHRGPVDDRDDTLWYAQVASAEAASVPSR